MRLLGVPGSLRRDSHNRRLLLAAAAHLPADVELVLFDELGTIPPYDEDVPDPDAVGEAVVRWRAALAAADAVLFSTPEYNASLPGQLKNALDWASRPFPDNALKDKPVAVVGASAGLFGAVWAQAELRKVLQTMGARVLDEELPVGQAHEAFDADGALVASEQRDALAALIDQLVRMARAQVEQAA